jgi:hypothetical protein
MTTTITLTDTGEAMLAYLFKGDTTTKGVVAYMAIGTGAAGGETATALTTEISRKAVTITVYTGAGTNANKSTCVATWGTSEGNGTITEACLITLSSGGNMFAIASISPGITKTSGYNLQLTWDVPFE